jgi:hypothetical protein
LLRHGVLISLDDERALVLARERCIELKSGALDPAATWSLLSDGLDPAACAKELGCPMSAVDRFLAILEEAGLVAGGPEGADMERDATINLLGDCVTMWSRHSMLHPIFALLSDGEERSSLLGSLLVELAHYTQRMPMLVAAAAENCPVEGAMQRLREFAAEEADHHRSIAEGAADLIGCDQADVLAARPVPATQGLLGMIEMYCREDPAMMAAILCFTETSPASAERSATDFLSLAASNGVSIDSVRPVAEHVREDGVLSHDQIGRQVLAEVLPDPVPGERGGELANAVHDVKHGFDLLYDSLVAVAESRTAPRLRRSLSWARL